MTKDIFYDIFYNYEPQRQRLQPKLALCFF